MHSYYRILLVLIVLAVPATAQAGVSIGIHVGLQAGGELFGVKSIPATPGNPNGGNFTTPDGRPLVGTEFSTEIQENVAFGIRVRVPVKQQWSVSLGVTGADTDIQATRRTVTENVDQIDYDQLFTLHIDLSAEFDLTRGRNRPFLALGVGFVRMDFEERYEDAAESLDQAPFALVAGGGMRLREIGPIDLDLEARTYIVSADFGAEEERLGSDVESFDGTNPLLLWQITAGIVYEF